MAEPVFGRLVTAMITPFDADLKVNFDLAQKLAVRQVEAGTDAIAVCATTGEAPTIEYQDKIQLFKSVIEAVDGKAKVIAYAGDNNTAESVAMVKDVAKLGVDGFLSVVPYYNKPPQEGIYQHFGAIASATDVPVILYNIPGRCGINMDAETTLRLANDFDTVVAVKEASSKMDQIAAIAKGAPSNFAVYSGNDDETLEIMGMGGVGVVSTTGNVAPARMKEMIELEAAGKHEEALKAHAALLPLMNELFVTANPIMAKEALDILGYPVGGLRLPLIKANAQQREELAEVLRQVGDIR